MIASAKSHRDPRLDVFRGLALVMIFINHLPGNVYEMFTNRNFGFSDAAEGFVLMSGMAAGIAYGGAFAKLPLWRAVAKTWGRAWTLYTTHLVITVMAIGIFTGGAVWFGIGDPLFKNNLAGVWEQPLEALFGISTLGHQLGYINILPMYAVFLLATPLFILVGRRAPLFLLLCSIVLWAVSGQFRINIPAYPNPGGWFLNPFSWQLIFVVGLLTGLALRDGRRFVPYSRTLSIICGAFLLFSLVWLKWDLLRDTGNASLGYLYSKGFPFWIVSFDKTFEAVPRLLHIMALAYVISVLPFVRRLCETRFAAPLALFGQYGLAIFASGTVLNMAMQVVKAGTEDTILIDTLLIGGGLLILYAIARTKKALASPVKAKS